MPGHARMPGQFTGSVASCARLCAHRADCERSRDRRCSSTSVVPVYRRRLGHVKGAANHAGMAYDEQVPDAQALDAR